MQVAFSAETPDKKLPNVKILATGGTIAGADASSTTTVGYTTAVVPVDNLINNVPELKKVANVNGEQIAQLPLLSSDDVDGIVVTHGTDTIEETAYFLNLVVKSDKPVVIVGAMRPPTAMSADGPISLYNAVILAGSKEAKGKGVLVCMNDTINGTRDVTKTNTALPDTFRAPELGYLGYMQDNKPHFYKQSTRKHTTQSEFDITGLTDLPRVDIVYGYANNSRVMLDAAVNAGAKGIFMPVSVMEACLTKSKNGLLMPRKKES